MVASKPRGVSGAIPLSPWTSAGSSRRWPSLPSARLSTAASRRSGRYGHRSQLGISTARAPDRRADSPHNRSRQATHAAVRSSDHSAGAGSNIADRSSQRRSVLRGICSSLRLVEPKRDPAAEKAKRGLATMTRAIVGRSAARRDRHAAGHRAGWIDSLNFARADSALCFSGLCGKRVRRTSSSSTASRRSPALSALSAALKRSFSVASVDGETAYRGLSLRRRRMPGGAFHRDRRPFRQSIAPAKQSVRGSREASDAQLRPWTSRPSDRTTTTPSETATRVTTP